MFFLYFLLVASFLLLSNLQTPDHCYNFNVESGTAISDSCGTGPNASVDSVGAGSSTCSSGGCNFSGGGSIRLFTGTAFFSTEYTIAAWVMTADTANIYTPFAVQSSSNELVAQIYLQSTTGKLQSACANGSHVMLTTTNVAQNQWVLVYVFYDSSNLKFGSYAARSFQEGNVGSGCTTSPATTDYISVGGVWDGSTFYARLKGQIRRMEIYNTAVITQSTSPSLLDVIKAYTCPNLANGGNYWCQGSEQKLHFEFATPLVSNNVVKDISFSNNDGTLPDGQHTVSNGSGVQIENASDKGELDFFDATPAFTMQMWVYTSSGDNNVQIFKLKSDGDLRLKYFNDGSLDVKIDTENSYNNIFPTNQEIHFQFDIYPLDASNSHIRVYVNGVEKLSTFVSQRITAGFYDQIEFAKRLDSGYIRKIKYYTLPRGKTLISNYQKDCDYNQWYEQSSETCQTPCASICTACFGSTNTGCYACATGATLSGTTCSCAAATYFDGSSCQNCHSLCSDCTGGSNLECSACTASNYFISPSYCLSKCPSNTYDNGGVCTNCPTECDNCTGGTSADCIRCKSPYFMHPTTPGTCILNCPTQYYKDTSTKECLQCNAICDECQGTTINDCIGCQTNYALITGTNTCVDYPCPDGYFDDSGTCSVCDTACLTCNAAGATGCVQCAQGYLMDPLTNTCNLGTCPSHYIIPTDGTRTCVECNTFCGECTALGNTNCVDCGATYYQVQGTSATCLDVCDQGWYINGALCSQCDTSCLECSGGNTASDCTSCSPGYYVQPDGSCVLNSCPSQYFKNTTTQVCDPCNGVCDECYGSGTTQCNACSGSNKAVQGTSLQCVASCTTGYYTSGSNCLLCHPSCADCSTGPSKTECDSCQVGRLLSTTGECVTACNDNQFTNTGTSQCDACHAYCDECTAGNDKTACVDCASNHYLVAANHCETECNADQYHAGGYVCQACDPACDGCLAAGSTECVNCDALYKEEVDADLSKKKCVNSCNPTGFYQSGSQCIPCHANCDTCNGGNPEDCLTCAASMYQMPDNSCVATCTGGYYADSASTCAQCHISCNDCVAPGDANSCTTCADTYFLDSGICTQTCSFGLYGNTVTGNCEACDAKCNGCNPDGTCSGCSPGYFNIGGDCIFAMSITGYTVDEDGNLSQVCGDGLNYGIFECDDGNQDDGDGCSSTCTIEPGYSCTLSTINSSNIGTNVCTKIGEILIISASIDNSLLLSVIVSPQISFQNNPQPQIRLVQGDGSVQVLNYQVETNSNQFTDTLKFNLDVKQSLSGQETVEIEFKGTTTFTTEFQEQLPMNSSYTDIPVPSYSHTSDEFNTFIDYLPGIIYGMLSLVLVVTTTEAFLTKIFHIESFWVLLSVYQMIYILQLMAGQKHSYLFYVLQIFSYTHGHSKALTSTFGKVVDFFFKGLTRIPYNSEFSRAEYDSSKFLHFSAFFCTLWTIYTLYFLIHRTIFYFSRQGCYIMMRKMNYYVNSNIPIRFALVTYLTLIIGTFLNFQNVRRIQYQLSASNASEIIVSLLCMLTMLTLSVVPFIYWNLVSKPQLKLERKKEKRKYSTLYAPLKLNEEKFLRILFYPLHLIRLMIVALCIIFLASMPLIQAIVLSLSCIFQIWYLIVLKPFLSKTIQFLYLFMNFAFLLLHMIIYMNYHLATYKRSNLELKDNIAVMTIILILSFLLALWILIIFDSVRNIHKKLAKKSNKDKNLKTMLAKVKRVGNVNQHTFQSTEVNETNSGLLNISKRNVRTVKNLKLSSDRVFSPRSRGSAEKLRKSPEPKDQSIRQNLGTSKKEIQLLPIDQEELRSYSARIDSTPSLQPDFEEMMRRRQFLDQLPLMQDDSRVFKVPTPSQ